MGEKGCQKGGSPQIDSSGLKKKGEVVRGGGSRGGGIGTLCADPN